MSNSDRLAKLDQQIADLRAAYDKRETDYTWLAQAIRFLDDAMRERDQRDLAWLRSLQPAERAALVTDERCACGHLAALHWYDGSNNACGHCQCAAYTRGKP